MCIVVKNLKKRGRTYFACKVSTSSSAARGSSRVSLALMRCKLVLRDGHASGEAARRARGRAPLWRRGPRAPAASPQRAPQRPHRTARSRPRAKNKRTHRNTSTRQTFFFLFKLITCQLAAPCWSASLSACPPGARGQRRSDVGGAGTLCACACGRGIFGR